MEGKRGRGRPRLNLLNWMMSEGYRNLRKKLNIQKHGAIGGLDIPEGRELKRRRLPKNHFLTTKHQPVALTNCE